MQPAVSPFLSLRGGNTSVISIYCAYGTGITVLEHHFVDASGRALTLNRPRIAIQRPLRLSQRFVITIPCDTATRLLSDGIPAEQYCRISVAMNTVPRGKLLRWFRHQTHHYLRWERRLRVALTLTLPSCMARVMAAPDRRDILGTDGGITYMMIQRG